MKDIEHIEVNLEDNLSVISDENLNKEEEEVKIK
jgi:hypothetical protein